MNTDKIDPNKNPAEAPPTEVPPKESKTELTEEELSKVSGGSSKSWGIIVGS
jgi:bacteriocin-like protein